MSTDDTQALATAAAEIERQRAVIRKVNARCDHLGMRLGEVIRERDALRASIAKLEEPVEDEAAWRLRFPGAIAAVEAAEREACAKVCEEIDARHIGGDVPDSALFTAAREIRQRHNVRAKPKTTAAPMPE